MKKINFLCALCFISNIFKAEYSYENTTSQNTAGAFANTLTIESAAEYSYENEIFQHTEETFANNRTIESAEDFDDVWDKILDEYIDEGTLVVFDMDEVLGTTGNGENYTHDNFQLSTELLETKKSWNEVIDTIHKKGGKAIVLTASEEGSLLDAAEVKLGILQGKGLRFNYFTLNLDSKKESCIDYQSDILRYEEERDDQPNFCFLHYVICSGRYSKSNILKLFLDNCTLYNDEVTLGKKIKRIIFIDNDEGNISSMQSVATQYQLISIHFTAIEKYLLKIFPYRV